MKREYKYITIEPRTDELTYDGKTAYQIVENKTKNILGILYWYKPWKEYVFTQWAERIIFNDGCLTDIVDFLKLLKQQKQ